MGRHCFGTAREEADLSRSEHACVVPRCSETSNIDGRTPTPKSLVRFFRIWGIDDIFSQVTRKKVTKAALRLRLGELDDKRNNIAHGDFAVEATYLDIVQYVSAVKTFCIRADARLARQLTSVIGDPPW